MNDVYSEKRTFASFQEGPRVGKPHEVTKEKQASVREHRRLDNANATHGSCSANAECAFVFAPT